MSGPQGKPFDIPKRLVWQAWKRVKANGGAAGADGVTIEAFEAGLRDNLYKIWNRMSSGAYFPPPVRAVEIPKASGGTRILGVPQELDRVLGRIAAPCADRLPDAGDHHVRHAGPPARNRELSEALICA